MLGFVVRARNEEQYIGFSLQSIFDCFGTETPVVVIDNDSTDDTLKVVKSFPKKFFNIHILRLEESEYTPGKSLNKGISYLKNLGCDIAGILSSHCEITKFDYNLLQSHFYNETCFAVMGKQIPIRRGKRITPRYIWANFQHENSVINLEENTLLDEKRYFLHNAFSFIKISHWNKLTFDETLAGKEDRHWAFNQIEFGNYFVFEPSLQCRHFWTEKGATWKD